MVGVILEFQVEICTWKLLKMYFCFRSKGELFRSKGRFLSSDLVVFLVYAQYFGNGKYREISQGIIFRDLGNDDEG